MKDWKQLELAGGLITFNLPPDWEWHPDAQGGGAIPPSHALVLHIRAEEVEDAAQIPNLSRMLAGFLTSHVRPVATDELHSFSVPGAQGFAWQYLEEWETEHIQAIRLWVMGNDLAWAFLNFQGSREAVQSGSQIVNEIVSSFSFSEEAF